MCCDGCKLESVSVAVAGGVMTITVVPAQAYVDGKRYPLLLCQFLPAHIGTEPVSISDGLSSYPILDSNAQPVVSGQLRGHRQYELRYGAGGTLSVGSIAPHFTAYSRLYCMEYSANAALQS